jgi:uncharacterized membrane protein YczE
MNKPFSRAFWIRVLLLLLGLAIAHLGVTLFLLTELGSDPFNVMIQGLTRTADRPLLTHGRVHLLVSLLIVLILLIVDRHYIGVGTLLCMALGGPIIDLYSLWLAPLIRGDAPLALRLPLLVLGCVILAFGMTIVIRSEAGTGPNDLVAVVISEKLHAPFGLTRVLVDLCFAGLGFLLGGTIGLGTLICAFVVGPAAQLFMPLSTRLVEACLKRGAA